MIISIDLENEHLKLVGHDLDLKDCDKKTGWEISTFAKTAMIVNWYKANKDQANTAHTTAMSLTGNTFILGHSLLTRRTVTALGKHKK